MMWPASVGGHRSALHESQGLQSLQSLSHGCRRNIRCCTKFGYSARPETHQNRDKIAIAGK
jgi:hypothetical protein